MTGAPNKQRCSVVQTPTLCWVSWLDAQNRFQSCCRTIVPDLRTDFFGKQLCCEVMPIVAANRVSQRLWRSDTRLWVHLKGLGTSRRQVEVCYPKLEAFHGVSLPTAQGWTWCVGSFAPTKTHILCLTLVRVQITSFCFPRRTLRLSLRHSQTFVWEENRDDKIWRFHLSWDFFCQVSAFVNSKFIVEIKKKIVRHTTRSVKSCGVHVVSHRIVTDLKALFGQVRNPLWISFAASCSLTYLSVVFPVAWVSLVQSVCQLERVRPSGRMVQRTGVLRTSTELFLQRRSITNLSSSLFGNSTQYTDINLSHNKITVIQSGVFVGFSKLVELYLSNNMIFVIQSGAFSGLPNLQLLDLSYNEITMLQSEAFMGLRRLLVLSLERNFISSFEVNNQMPNLVCFKMGFNLLPAMEQRMLNRLKVLKSLHLNNNQIGFVENNTLSSTSLKWLDLSSNKMHFVGPGIFLQQNTSASLNLLALNLAKNNMSVLRDQTFAKFHFLSHLNLSFNFLSVLNSGVFSGLSALRSLFLQHNLLSVVPVGVFNDLYSLETLALNWNHISTIESIAFSGLKHLQLLDLSHNKLGHLSPEMFAGLDHLFEIFVNNNSILSVNSETIFELMFVEKLHLSCNNLSALFVETFPVLKNIRFLDVSKNNISKIEPGAFLGLTTLFTLDLHSNSLSLFRRGAFSRLTVLQSLNLQNNQLSHISIDLWVSHEDLVHNGTEYDNRSQKFSLVDLNLSHNRIIAIEDRSFQLLPGLRILRLDFNALTVITRYTFTGLWLLEQLYLHNNKLTSIENSAFLTMTKLFHLSLFNNDLTTLSYGALSLHHMPQSLQLGPGNRWNCSTLCWLLRAERDYHFHRNLWNGLSPGCSSDICLVVWRGVWNLGEKSSQAFDTIQSTIQSNEETTSQGL